MLSIPEHPRAQRVFYYFDEISKIPRGSGNTKPVADYLESFAKKHSLEYYRDEADNILIRKRGTRGYENHEAVIIQGHTDIVAQRTPDCSKDFKTEGLDIYREADFIKARGTTLGADDGIAVAYALALLESGLHSHPPLEILLTSDEEIGLVGAEKFDKSILCGRTLINIDTDEEGVFVVGCAGGVRCDTLLSVKRERCDLPAYKLRICGLTGGHSGTEIAKGRANAIKLGAEVLSAIGEVRICSFESGNMDNAIPRELVAEFCTAVCPRASFDAVCADIKARFCDAEPNMELKLSHTVLDTLPCDKQSSEKILGICNATPFGPQKICEALGGTPESSLNSGIAKLGEDFSLCTSVRASRVPDKEQIVGKLRAIADAAGADFSARGDYPGWEYKSDSRIKSIALNTYSELYGKEAQAISIHAGLECGVFADAIAGLDCISAGPDIFDIHTTEERLSISSAARFWDFLCRVLEKL